MTAPPQQPISPSWTWGSSGTLVFDLTGEPGQAVSASVQLAQVSLPEPAVCSFYLQATFLGSVPRDDTMNFLVVNLVEGVGRVAVPRQISFNHQPANLAPLEFTLPFVPVHALQVNVEGQLNHTSEDPNATARVELYFVLSPITRIPQNEQKLTFGMAMPGEADDLDDELREDLETEGPTARAAVMQGRNRVDGDDHQPELEQDEPDDEPDDDEPDEPQPPAVAPWLLRVVEQLTQRYGRPPKREELRAAVQRLRARRARQARRG